jgi:hypothetical protein
MINLYNVLYPSGIDWTATGTMITAIVTSGLVLLAWRQLKKMNEISRADFDQRFKNDFFNEKTQQLFMMFQYDLISFKTEFISYINDEFPYFEIDVTKIDSNPIFKMYLDETKDRYSAYEVDNLLLGHFEDLGLFYKKGLMDIEFIYEGFDYYIEEIHNNKHIQNYIRWTRDREEDGEDIFDKFDLIFDKVKSYGKNKKK